MNGLESCIAVVKELAPLCPKCGKQRVVPVVYGPDRDELIAFARCRAVELGTHWSLGGKPLWHCHVCNDRFSTDGTFAQAQYSDLLSMLRTDAAALSEVERIQARAASFLSMFYPAFAAGFLEVVISPFDGVSAHVVARAEGIERVLPNVERSMFDDFTQSLDSLRSNSSQGCPDDVTTVTSFLGRFEVRHGRDEMKQDLKVTMGGDKGME